jgi:hypothetical protein
LLLSHTIAWLFYQSSCHKAFAESMWGARMFAQEGYRWEIQCGEGRYSPWWLRMGHLKNRWCWRKGPSTPAAWMLMRCESSCCITKIFRENCCWTISSESGTQFSLYTKVLLWTKPDWEGMGRQRSTHEDTQTLHLFICDKLLGQHWTQWAPTSSENTFEGFTNMREHELEQAVKVLKSHSLF